MRIFGSDRISPIMQRLGMEEGVPIEHKLVTRSIEHAQKQVESRNFEIRKHLLEYDDVMNKQREAVYSLRRKVPEKESHTEYIMELAEDILRYQIETRCPAKTDPRDWDIPNLLQDLHGQFNVDVDRELIKLKEDPEEIYEYVHEQLQRSYEDKKNRIGADRWN